MSSLGIRKIHVRGKWADPEDLHLLGKIPNPVPSKIPLLQKKTYMMDYLLVEYIIIPSINKERLVPLNPVVALNQKMSTGKRSRVIKRLGS